MVYTTDPLPAVVFGQKGITDTVVSAFSTPESVYATLAFLNTVFNSIIGLLITLAVIAVFAHLIGWIISKENSELKSMAIRGVIRSMIALFLMINIWSIFRLLIAVVDLSNTAAFLVYLFAVMIFGFWTLFSVGDGLVRLLSIVADRGLDLLMAGARRMGANNESVIAHWLQRVDQKTLRFIVLGMFVLITSSLSLIYFSAPLKSNSLHTAPTYTFEVQHESGDVMLEPLKKNRYENTRYGITVQFPEDWNVTVATSSNGLVAADNKQHTLVAQLNAGSFGFTSENSMDPFLDTTWTVQKSILSGIVIDSNGVIQSGVYSYDDIGGTRATQFIINAYWPINGVITACYHYYYVFGRGPVFYTMEFNTCAKEAMHEESGKIVDQILKTIEIY